MSYDGLNDTSNENSGNSYSSDSSVERPMFKPKLKELLKKSLSSNSEGSVPAAPMANSPVRVPPIAPMANSPVRVPPMAPMATLPVRVPPMPAAPMANSPVRVPPVPAATSPVRVAPASNSPVSPPLKRQTSTQGFDKTIPEEKIKYDETIVEVNHFLDTLIGFKEGTHARKGVHEFVYYFCENADPDQVVDFLNAVLLPLQFNLETCRGMVSRIGNGYTLVSGRPPLSYLRMFSLDPSDQLPLALRHINKKNIDEGYLQEGTLNQYNDQALLSHTMIFFETELRKRKEEFTKEQISILLMDPRYKEGNALTICGVEVIKGKGRGERELEDEEEDEEDEEEEGPTRLDFSPEYKIAGHVSNIKNLTLALVALADTNKDLLEHQETPYQEQFATLQLELMMLMKLGRKFNTQHETLNYEFPDENMKLVTSSYLSRLYVFAGNFRDMVRKEYLVEQNKSYEDKAQGRPFEKLFLFNLARSIALIACTVPEMEDAILLSKKLGPEPQRLRIFFQEYAKATIERNEIFLKICEKTFTSDMFQDFPQIDKITIKTVSAVFNKYFLPYFKPNGKVIGVFPEVVPFKEAKTLPKVSLHGLKSGASRKYTRKQLRTLELAQSRNPDQSMIDQFNYEFVKSIEETSIPTKDYNSGYKDGVRLNVANKDYSNNPEYLQGYMSGQRSVSGISGMIIEAEENKVEPEDGQKSAEVYETRAKMAYNAALTIQMLTFEGMEKTLGRIVPLLKERKLHECLRYFSNKAEIAAVNSETSYNLSNANYNTFLQSQLTQPKKRNREQIINDEKLRILRVTVRREKKASENARQCAEKAKMINIPTNIPLRVRPMSISFKSKP
jgi:hypothetical protein